MYGVYLKAEMSASLRVANIGPYAAWMSSALQRAVPPFKNSLYNIYNQYGKWDLRWTVSNVEEQKYIDKTENNAFNIRVKSVLLCRWHIWTVTNCKTNKIKTFVKRLLRTIMGTRWPEVLRNNELWEVTGQKATMFRTGMGKWWWIGHSLRRGMNPLRTKLWAGIRKEPVGQEDRSKPGGGPFWRRQDNEAKHGERG